MESVTQERFDKALLEKTKALYNTGFLFAPLLYLSFSFVDYFYAPQKWVTFFFLRVIHFIFVIFLKIYFDKKPRSLSQYTNGGIIWSLVAASLINIMILITQKSQSPYYAGLGLVSTLTIFFLPYNKKSLIYTLSGIYLPYIAIGLFDSASQLNMTFLLNLGFITGGVIAALAVRSESQRALIKEIIAQQKLEHEIVTREIIIKERTEENIKLKQLSNQFSPQLVKAIQSGEVQLQSEAHSEKICAIFVDIVNSTQKITTLPIEESQKTISLFTSDCVSTFLKYDLTLDKFLGDGFLAFCNDPIQYPDYIDRVLFAAHELMQKLTLRQDQYQQHWKGPFEVRMGISAGTALIGFYGVKAGFQSYTGLGPVMNKASRLCSQIAKPNQIVTDFEVVQGSSPTRFKFDFMGTHHLKGFEESGIRCFQALDGIQNQIHLGPLKEGGPDLALICPECQSEDLFLATDTQGHYVFKCRQCQTTLSQTTTLSKTSPLG